MILAIDFDNVLHNPYDVEPGYKLGKPVKGAVEAMQQLAKSNTLIIHTIWATDPQRIKAIQNWLDYFKIPYDQVTAQKPDATWYVDDKALHFDNWENVLLTLQ
jgi:hypothetical protein